VASKTKVSSCGEAKDYSLAIKVELNPVKNNIAK